MAKAFLGKGMAEKAKAWVNKRAGSIRSANVLGSSKALSSKSSITRSYPERRERWLIRKQ